MTPLPQEGLPGTERPPQHCRSPGHSLQEITKRPRAASKKPHAHYRTATTTERARKPCVLCSLRGHGALHRAAASPRRPALLSSLPATPAPQGSNIRRIAESQNSIDVDFMLLSFTDLVHRNSNYVHRSDWSMFQAPLLQTVSKMDH